MEHYELRYLVAEETALELRNLLSNHWTLDKHGARSPDLSYSIRDYYFDSKSLLLYEKYRSGDKACLNLRFRRYEPEEGTRIQAEVKWRMNDAVKKTRSTIELSSASAIARGQYFPEQNDPSADALMTFLTLLKKYEGLPKLTLEYRREAWNDPYGSNRVTFDRNIVSAPWETFELTGSSQKFCSLFGNQMVVEFKFAGRFPELYKNIVRAHGLKASPFIKYSNAIKALG